VVNKQMDSHRALTRFATLEDVMSEEFTPIIQVLDRITVEYNLPDHSDVNKERYPWAVRLLGFPAFYAARMWEYPFALFSAELQAGMRCVDVGCGMTAFTIYLKEVAQCEAIGIDPDVFDAGIRYKGHGVSREFARKTGLQIIQCGMEAIALPSNTLDRVFCLSVIEHLPADVARRGVQEMARILKPGGRAIITVDVNMLSEVSRPFDLIWESGLLPLGDMDLRWPARRFGIFCDRRQPADVFGMTLVKDDYPVETQYSGVGGDPSPPVIGASLVPTMRWQPANGQQETSETMTRPLWHRLASRIKRALLVLLRG
jgi:SAM-dependent methyltransferase